MCGLTLIFSPFGDPSDMGALSPPTVPPLSALASRTDFSYGSMTPMAAKSRDGRRWSSLQGFANASDSNRQLTTVGDELWILSSASPRGPLSAVPRRHRTYATSPAYKCSVSSFVPSYHVAAAHCTRITTFPNGPTHFFTMLATAPFPPPLGLALPHSPALELVVNQLTVHPGNFRNVAIVALQNVLFLLRIASKPIYHIGSRDLDQM